MIRFRPFRNHDTPSLVQVWHNQPAARGLVQPVTTGILERYVFSKLYFDREGLIVAENEGQIIGFVHAGFGPNADFSGLSTDAGVLSMLLVSMSYPEKEAVAQQLLERGESYLRERGARTLFAGECYPYCPFYFGLYGGSHLSGVLQSDTWHSSIYARAGYEPQQRSLVLQSQLAEFRPVVNRQQMSIRRRTRMDLLIDIRAATWWDACLAAQHDFTVFRLMANDTPTLWASAMFWDMEPLASSWGVHAAGLIHYETADDCADQGAELYVLSESFKHLQATGVTLVETQLREDDAARLKLLSELGFRRVDTGVMFTKT